MTLSDPAGLARFLTLADVATVLAISVRQAYALVRSGELPAIKVGASGQWRVENSVLDAYIEGKYEENRRRAMWQQAAYADVTELFGDR
jgi:excisionase family DNA binding protein